jgi:hypothetical protein
LKSESAGTCLNDDEMMNGAVQFFSSVPGGFTMDKNLTDHLLRGVFHETW